MSSSPSGQRHGFVGSEETQCVGKIRHANRKRAKLAIRQMRRRIDRGTLRAYLCPHCGFWHTGRWSRSRS